MLECSTSHLLSVSRCLGVKLFRDSRWLPDFVPVVLALDFVSRTNWMSTSKGSLSFTRSEPMSHRGKALMLNPASLDSIGRWYNGLDAGIGIESCGDISDVKSSNSVGGKSSIDGRSRSGMGAQSICFSLLLSELGSETNGDAKRSRSILMRLM